MIPNLSNLNFFGDQLTILQRKSISEKART
jgi:hypothetical protein